MNEIELNVTFKTIYTKATDEFPEGWYIDEIIPGINTVRYGPMPAAYVDNVRQELIDMWHKRLEQFKVARPADEYKDIAKQFSPKEWDRLNQQPRLTERSVFVVDMPLNSFMGLDRDTQKAIIASSPQHTIFEGDDRFSPIKERLQALAGQPGVVIPVEFYVNDVKWLIDRVERLQALVDAMHVALQQKRKADQFYKDGGSA